MLRGRRISQDDNKCTFLGTPSYTQVQYVITAVATQRLHSSHLGYSTQRVLGKWNQVATLDRLEIQKSFEDNSEIRLRRRGEAQKRNEMDKTDKHGFHHHKAAQLY